MLKSSLPSNSSLHGIIRIFRYTISPLPSSSLWNHSSSSSSTVAYSTITSSSSSAAASFTSLSSNSSSSAFYSSSPISSAPKSPFRQLLDEKNKIKETAEKEKEKDLNKPSSPSSKEDHKPSTLPSADRAPASPFRDPNASIFGDQIRNSFQRASEHQRQVSQKHQTNNPRNETQRNSPESNGRGSFGGGGGRGGGDQRSSNQRQSRFQSDPKINQKPPNVDATTKATPSPSLEADDELDDPETIAGERAHLASARTGQARHQQKLVHLEHKRKEVKYLPLLYPSCPFQSLSDPTDGCKDSCDPIGAICQTKNSKNEISSSS
jgi:hypothetical protein